MKILTKLSFYSLLLIVMSCTSDLNEGLNEEVAISDRDYWQSLLVMGGVPNDYIVQTEEGFVIDKDVIVEYKHFEERLEKMEEMARVKSEQIVTSRLQGSNCAGSPPLDNCNGTPRMNMIYLSFNINVLETWRQATRNAVDNWNAQTPSNAINFGITDQYCSSGGGGIQGISVIPYNAGNQTNIAVVTSIPEVIFGFGGVPSQIKINVNHFRYNTTELNRKTSTMMHEMGHAIGLMHPGGNYGTSCLLTGTTDNDCQSIMNTDCRDRTTPFLTAEDRIGIGQLYPRLGDVRSGQQCIKIWGHCGNTIGCTTCPPGFTYDGANCYSGRHIPQGFTPFVLGRTLYTFAINGNQCPPGFTYDGANCNSGTHYPPGFIPFVWNNTFYTVANCN